MQGKQPSHYAITLSNFTRILEFASQRKDRDRYSMKETRVKADPLDAGTVSPEAETPRDESGQPQWPQAPTKNTSSLGEGQPHPTVTLRHISHNQAHEMAGCALLGGWQCIR